MKDNDKALRQIASDTLKAMNLITNTSVTDLANKVRLHRTNVSTFINQDRLHVLGWPTIRRLLRIFGFAIQEDGLTIRESESCPVIAYPHTDAIEQGLTALIGILKSSGMKCQFRTFEIGSDDLGVEPFNSGGLIFAEYDKRVWTAIGLERQGSQLQDFFNNQEEVKVADPILIHEEQFMSWEDSTPHRSEVLQYFKSMNADA